MDPVGIFRWIWDWSGERPTVSSTARFCTHSHLMIYFLGAPEQRWPRHVDVDLTIGKRRGGKVSVYELLTATLDGVDLRPSESGFKAVEVEGGSTPVTQHLVLTLPGDQHVVGEVGSRVVLELKATHRDTPILHTTTITE
jgi:hypothetical protein